MRRLDYDNTDSTNSLARRLLESDEPAPFVVVAATQSAGRGRNGRVWQSPRGGAWMSVVWPIKRPPQHYQSVPLVAGLAAARALQETLNADAPGTRHAVRIKWPNDVLLDGKKIAGVLCETVLHDGGPGHLVVGVGINVDFLVDALDGSLRYPVTTLRQTLDRKVAVGPVIDRFLSTFVALMADFDQGGLSAPLLRELRQKLAHVGSARLWRFEAEEIVGTVDGIDSAGRLLLNVDGDVRVLDHGELGHDPTDSIKTLT